MQKTVFEQFRQTGADLAALGLISSHGGNLSIRHQGRLLVTAHFAMLGRLEPGDLVELPLDEDPDRTGGEAPGDAEASGDTRLHRLIYQLTPAGAVVHAHPAHAIALSLAGETIVPLDLEGSVLLREIAVVEPGGAERRLPQLLQERPALMVRGHGSYAVGRTLPEALAFTSALALSCRITWLASAQGGPAPQP